jgi:2-polyprenyl-6-methoxyphenol hydroxylase-like FAD-dependent oxidoreductase
MRVLVVGSGPTGLILGAALAGRGHQVASVDRDPGPSPDGWPRRGVMQFAHAHNFRPQVGRVLKQEWPAAYDAWLRLGATPIDAGPAESVSAMGGMLSRRETLERALRQAAAGQPGLTLRSGHVDRLTLEDGGVRGAIVDGTAVDADLVIDASGRAGRVGSRAHGSRAHGSRAHGSNAHGSNAPGERVPDQLGGDCGLAYINRTYRLRAGAAPGPLNSPLGFLGEFSGYQCLVFLHEHRHFSVVVIRPTADAELKLLHATSAFDAACAAIPALAEWTDPARAVPTSGVLVGGALRNVYRSQTLLPGLVTVGDAVATTTPTRGRGVAMACMQIEALLRLLDEGADPTMAAWPFDAWCAEHIKPWVADHIAIDGGMVRRWRGEDIDLSAPLTSDLIADAVRADPRIAPYAAGYFTMAELPATLQPVEPLARAVYERGWRPPLAEGPSRDELLAIIQGQLVQGQPVAMAGR